MSTPAEHIEDAINQATIGRDGWAISSGCEHGCWCSVCLELNSGLANLSAALAEMNKAGDE